MIMDEATLGEGTMDEPPAPVQPKKATIGNFNIKGFEIAPKPRPIRVNKTPGRRVIAANVTQS